MTVPQPAGGLSHPYALPCPTWVALLLQNRISLAGSSPAMTPRTARQTLHVVFLSPQTWAPAA